MLTDANGDTNPKLLKLKQDLLMHNFHNCKFLQPLLL